MAKRERPVARVLQHVAPEGPGRVASALAAHDFSIAVTRIDRGEPVPKDLDGVAALVVMGGPMGVYESDRYSHLKDELRLIDLSLREGVPVLGVCLGAQLLAATLGARVYQGAQKEIGWFPVALKKEAIADPLFASAPGSFWGLHWHGDVFDLPSDAVSLARSELTEHQAYRFEKNAYGLLFHLEAGIDDVRAMAAAFEGELESDGIDGGALIATAREMDPDVNRIAESIFGGFARLAAES
jgi:GMP synthase (glutamine-hydrolysing)